MWDWMIIITGKTFGKLWGITGCFNLLTEVALITHIKIIEPNTGGPSINGIKIYADVNSPSPIFRVTELF